MAHRKIRTWGVTLGLILGATILAWAANTKLSSLSAGGAMADTDLFYDVQTAGAGGAKETGTQIWTWIQSHLASPGAIGGSTPAAGNFTTLGATGALTTNVTGGGTQCLQASNTGVITGTASVCSSNAISLTFVVDGGGSTITTGLKGYIEVPWNGTITEATLLADQSGSVVVDVWKCTYAQFDASATHPVAADKITASAPPTISTSTKSQDSTLTGWTTTVSLGDVLAFNVNSATTIQRVTLSLRVTKS